MRIHKAASVLVNRIPLHYTVLFILCAGCGIGPTRQGTPLQPYVVVDTTLPMPLEIQAYDLHLSLKSKQTGALLKSWGGTTAKKKGSVDNGQLWFCLDRGDRGSVHLTVSARDATGACYQGEVNIDIVADVGSKVGVDLRRQNSQNCLTVDPGLPFDMDCSGVIAN